MNDRNPFVGASVGSRYAKSRPVFHGQVAALISDRLGSQRRAIDVGCGTGLSTRSLTGVSTSVVGIDASEGMLRAAAPAEGVRFVLGAAERLPFEDVSFDLATTSSSIHWIAKEQFLPELARVLTEPGHWVTYDDRFLGNMRGIPEFREWMRTEYEVAFPIPPRDWFDLHDAGPFELESQAELRRFEAMTTEDVANYLMTTSGSLRVVQGGRSQGDVKAWLLDELSRFADPCGIRLSLEFATSVAFLRLERTRDTSVPVRRSRRGYEVA